MTEPVRFSRIANLPALYKAAVVFGMASAMSLFFLICFGGIAWDLWAPPGRRLTDLHWTVWVPLAIGVASVLGGVLIVGRRVVLNKVTAALAAWVAKADPASVELPGAVFYARLFRANRARRAAAVAAFLQDVPASRCRAMTVGEIAVTPADDGNLSEECDAFEGRSKASLRWLGLLVTLPFVFQIVLAFATNGFNVFSWSGTRLLTAIPAVFNLVLMVYIWGLVRPLGVVVLATPRRVQFGSLRGTKVFTTDDSVLLISGAGQQFVVMFYRDDGQTAYIRYTNPRTPGLQQLISRWCVVEPGATTVVEPPPRVLDVGAIRQ